MNPRLTLGTGLSRRQLCTAVGAGLMASLAGVDALAQAFPAGPVRIVVPGPAGSSVDNLARALAESLSEGWNHTPVLVDNRPGASTTLGAALVAKAAPDGLTLLLTPTTFVQAPYLYQKLSYDPLDSFAPIAQLADSNLWFGIHADIPAKTLREFLALAKNAPGKYAYASAGPGTTPHLYGYDLGRQAGVDLLHVPYKGIPPAVIDIAGGRVSGMFAPLSDLLPQVQANRMRLLASTGSARSSLTPDVPTLKEAGLDGLDTVGFLGLLAPANTPSAIVDQIAKAVAVAMAKPKIRSAFTSLGFEPVSSTPVGFATLLRSQVEVWRRTIAAAGVKLE